LLSCSKASSVKRVVFTSSMSTVLPSQETITSDVVVHETWFADPASCEKSKHWYKLSKILAEEAAWKFAKVNGIDMVTVNPGWVIGPLQPTFNATVEPILKYVNRDERALDAVVPVWVDVRDTANAHVLAFEIHQLMEDIA
ncbi:Tetraketide alpha-pyrone reductase 1, partial [Morella rubra]